MEPDPDSGGQLITQLCLIGHQNKGLSCMWNWICNDFPYQDLTQSAPQQCWEDQWHFDYSNKCLTDGYVPECQSLIPSILPFVTILFKWPQNLPVPNLNWSSIWKRLKLLKSRKGSNKVVHIRNNKIIGF